MPELPVGTVTFLLTDIEGSTRLWERDPGAMSQAVALHETLARKYIEQCEGVLVKSRGEGDSLFAVFDRATDAVLAAAMMQSAFHATTWPIDEPIRVRMAIHTGEPELRDGDYFGTVVNRCARLRSVGHGAQVLLSHITTGLVRDFLPASMELRDLGEFRLRDLIRPERIYQLVMDGLPSHFPPLKTIDTRPNNLPLQRDGLIGREREMNAIHDLIRRSDVRLVTLTGPGGIGKTRLSMQVAADNLDFFEDGIFFVALAPVTDPAFVLPTIAATLDIRETPSLPLLESLKDKLREKQTLLILDNFEQVIAAASHIPGLLEAAPGLKVLVTSRIVLRIRGEVEYQVPALALPDPKRLPSGPALLSTLNQYDAVRLFIERAQSARHDFAITTDNAPAVAEICYRLDGLPLAIELAASRIRSLSPQAMLTRLNNRLKLLTAGPRDLPTRHQTLRAAIEWSYDLLDAPTQTLFRRLAVFVDGCTLAAAEAVLGYGTLEGDNSIDVLDGIEALVSQSLLRQDEQNDSEPRFVMLQTIREYAAERLEASGEAVAAFYHHAQFFLDFVKEAEPQMFGDQTGEWLNQLEADHDNIRAALRWYLDRGDGEQGLGLAGALWRFWEVRGYLTEGRTWLEQMLRIGQTASPGLRARALNAAGTMARNQGDYVAAREFYQASLDLSRELGDTKGITGALSFLGLVARARGDYTTAQASFEEALAIRRRTHDRRGIAGAMYNLGVLACDRGEWATAERLLQQSLGIRRELGDKLGVAYALLALGDVARARSQFDMARERYQESLILDMELGDKLHMALCFHGLAATACHQGQCHLARSLYLDSLTTLQELGSRREMVGSLIGLAGVATEEVEVERAARLFGAAEAILLRLNARLSPIEDVDFSHYVARLRAHNATQFDTAWISGRMLSLDEAVEYALEDQPM